LQGPTTKKLKESAFGFHLARARHPACLLRVAVKLTACGLVEPQLLPIPMGADLFISQLFDPQYKKWQKKFYKAVAYRDRLPAGSPEQEEAQKRVVFCFEKMYEQGYFRDSYNDSSLLWKFDLSWWDDVIPMLNDKAQLIPESASKLLAMLAEREQLFECNLASEQEPMRRYFRREYTVFKRFLNQAIQLRVPIDCSL
jgi:hypothetical protein